MEGLLYVLWFVGIAALIIWSQKRTSRRAQEKAQGRAELKALAEGRGWTYATGVPRLCGEFAGAGPIPFKTNEAGGNVVTGTHRGLAFKAFEYQVSLGFGGGIDEHRSREQINYHPVWAVKLSVPLPDIRVVHRDWRGRGSTGRPLITGVPQLDENFRIVSEDEERARELLFGGLDRFLLSDSRTGEWPLEVRHGHLLTWRSREMISAGNLDAGLDFLADAVGALTAQTP